MSIREDNMVGTAVTACPPPDGGEGHIDDHSPSHGMPSAVADEPVDGGCEEGQDLPPGASVSEDVPPSPDDGEDGPDDDVGTAPVMTDDEGDGAHGEGDIKLISPGATDDGDMVTEGASSGHGEVGADEEWEPRGASWWALRIILAAVVLFVFICLRPV